MEPLIRKQKKVVRCFIEEKQGEEGDWSGNEKLQGEGEHYGKNMGREDPTV